MRWGCINLALPQIVQEFYQRKAKQQSEKKQEDGDDAKEGAKEGNLIDA